MNELEERVERLERERESFVKFFEELAGDAWTDHRMRSRAEVLVKRLEGEASRHDQD